MIQQLDVENFTVFKKATFEFGSQLNVFIGENGTGKTQILKLIYAVIALLPKYRKDINDNKKILKSTSLVHQNDLDEFKATFNIELIADLMNLNFKLDKISKRLTKIKQTINIEVLKHNALANIYTYVNIVFSNDKNRYGITLHYDELGVDIIYQDDILHIIPSALFIPVHELLTIYPNYQSLSKMYHLPYDATVDHAIVKLGLPYLKETPKEYDEIIKVLEEAIDGKIFLKNERFYFSPNSANDQFTMDVNMAAEGWRKLGMVLQLLKNGGLGKGMILLWDEPEANLNPKLIKLVAQVIVKLSHLDIQTFITTHSLFLLREIDILVKSDKKGKKDDTRYFNFPKKGVVEQGSSPEELGDILLLDESLAQSDRFMEMEE